MNVVIAGVGGQGTVLSSRLVAYMGMEADLLVRTAETIGMAQRGGCVMSHVRIGDATDDQLASPLVPFGRADVVCAFEPGEGTRALRYLSPEGTLVLATRAVMPVTAMLDASGYDPEAHISYLRERLGQRLVPIDPADVTERLGSDRPMNVVLLGAATASGALGFSLDALKGAVRALVKPQYVDLNINAAELGAKAYLEQSTRW
jgi:indolepyruvate ferredoxin oxidoreductase beta subunit